MSKQFNDVNSRRGAPMGRREKGHLETSDPRTVRLFQVRLDSGGYDDGGAYWGNGGRLWCAVDDDGNRRFIRAGSRERAALELDIPNTALKRGLEGAGLAYGQAVLDGRAPMPDGCSVQSVCEWMQSNGAKMGQAL